jgi:SAM-dependent methyltransferase
VTSTPPASTPSSRRTSPILEVGVGTGVVVLGLIKRGRQVVALDISAPMLLRAQKRPGVARHPGRRIGDGSGDGERRPRSVGVGRSTRGVTARRPTRDWSSQMS